MWTWRRLSLLVFPWQYREFRVQNPLTSIGIRHVVGSQNANNLRKCQKRCELCSNSYREKNWRVTYSCLYLLYQISILTDRRTKESVDSLTYDDNSKAEFAFFFQLSFCFVYFLLLRRVF